MANYMEALKRPFTDIKKLIIGIIIAMIPIVNFIAAGYYLKCAKTAMQKKFKLPEWENWTDLFVTGLIAIVIGVIYLVPVIILGIVILGAGLISGFLPSMFSAGASNFPTNLLTGATMTGMVVLLLLAIVLSYVATGAVLNYAAYGNFKAAFDFEKIGKRIMRGKFFVGFVVAVVFAAIIFAVLGILVGWIPLLGMGVISFIAGVISYTILGEAYA